MSYCITIYILSDNNPPVYKTCPTSIAAFEDEIITWDIPEPYDNVAIKSEKFKSLHENNSKFKVGSHVVMYILTDDQGNIGICNFLVAIYERGNLTIRVSEGLLLNANPAIFQLYHGENNLIFNEMMMRVALY